MNEMNIANMLKLSDGDIVKLKIDGQDIKKYYTFRVLSSRKPMCFFEEYNSKSLPNTLELLELFRISKNFEVQKVNKNIIYKNAKCQDDVICPRCPLQMIKCDGFHENCGNELGDIWEDVLRDFCVANDNVIMSNFKSIRDVINHTLNEIIEDEEVRKRVEKRYK